MTNTQTMELFSRMLALADRYDRVLGKRLVAYISYENVIHIDFGSYTFADVRTKDGQWILSTNHILSADNPVFLACLEWVTEAGHLSWPECAPGSRSIPSRVWTWLTQMFRR